MGREMQPYCVKCSHTVGRIFIICHIPKDRGHVQRLAKTNDKKDLFLYTWWYGATEKLSWPYLCHTRSRRYEFTYIQESYVGFSMHQIPYLSDTKFIWYESTYIHDSYVFFQYTSYFTHVEILRPTHRLRA